MGLLRVTTAALAVLGSALAAPTELAQRASPVCDASTKICFSETVAGSISFKIAIPDSAAAGKPFDILLSMTAPKTLGWAGIAWGGQMANNPLTLGWANGASATVSSRLATGHTFPQPYTGATYTVLPSTVSNATHWKLDVLCSGCSTWSAKSLDPTAAATFAYASAAGAPADPANNASRFSIHNAKGKFSSDLSAAKNANFDALVKAAASAKAVRL